MVPQSLSRVQEAAYLKLKLNGGWMSAYGLNVSISTMRALEKRRLVRSKGHFSPGSFVYPSIGIKYKVI